MNSQEGMDLAKMAVTALLVVFVIGAVMTLFYILMHSSNVWTKDLGDTVEAGTTARLYDLHDKSLSADTNDLGVDGHPLVSTACNILSEYNETDLLYIYVTQHNQNNSYEACYLYTYPGITITDTSSLPHGSASIKQFNNSQVPITQAVKQLLKYTGERCHLTVAEVTKDKNTYIGIIVEVLMKE